MTKRTDYYHDPDAPQANSLVVGSSAVIVDDEGRILLQRRSDSGNWALPGGAMDIGETLAQSAIREVKEETGFDVRIDRIVGIYSDPGHVFAYEDGEVRQEFSICVACVIVGGTLTVSQESTGVRFVSVAEVPSLTMHSSIRKRIDDYLNNEPPVLRLYWAARKTPPPGTDPSVPFAEIAALRERYLGPALRAGTGTRDVPAELHPDLLARTSFERPERVLLPGRKDLTRDVDDVIANVLSQSFLAPHLFGTRLDQFTADLRQLLTAATPTGRFWRRCPW
jgi:ADP-ribose pyrophosphatase YjhB (NUDIX family)